MNYLQILYNSFIFIDLICNGIYDTSTQNFFKIMCLDLVKVGVQFCSNAIKQLVYLLEFLTAATLKNWIVTALQAFFKIIKLSNISIFCLFKVDRKVKG